jgi:hypothetical protein
MKTITMTDDQYVALQRVLLARVRYCATWAEKAHEHGNTVVQRRFEEREASARDLYETVRDGVV